MEDTKTYNIKGKISYNNEPITGAKVEINSNVVYSDSSGNFTINGSYIDLFNLIITKSNFATYTYLPFDSNNNIKSDLGVIELVPLQIDLNQQIAKTASLPESSIKAITASKTNFETLQQKKLNNLLTTLTFTLLPLILKLIAKFGVSNAKEALVKKFTTPNSCPTPQELTDIINKKNKLVKQLNIAYKTIEVITYALTGIEALIISLEILQKSTLGIPTPTPPLVSASEKTLDQQIKKYKTIVEVTLVTLLILKDTLSEIINYLNLLDQFIQHCAPNSTQTQEQLSTELIALTQQQTQQGQPVYSNVNGFEMGVETETTENPLKRRRAIARNKQGVVMLRGEWSFSSIDQILIDELVFYIQTNNLKAD